MGASTERPDPDALLRRVQQDAARANRGKLRVFFGFAPGVGKTYRMLQVARDLVADQKVDVVVGLVEVHGRRDTAALTLGLELLARRKVGYRGRNLEEFDLSAALARRPKIILVDELAHTNVPGSLHPKRWQDVRDLLAAGIDVYTTMNVQHLESLNDVIEQITGIQVRETVPDSVLDTADAVELVDIAPEELLERLREGKVYLPDQARRAAEAFFRRGNLLALRELALRRTAQHVDEDVLEYREEHGVSTPWPSSERILVCVGPAPSSARLVRAAARMAAGLRCPWVAAYVEASALGNMNETDRQHLEDHLRVAESLGATVARLSGQRIPDALLAYARKHNVTRIVIGKPTHSRWRDRVRGSLLNDVVRGSAEIDVHVITGDGARSHVSGNDHVAPRRAALKHYLWAGGIVALTLGIAAAVRAAMALPDLEMLFLLAVMVTAAWFGRGPSLLSAALGVACYDFFFVPPFHTFSVADRVYFLTFAMMFGVGLVMSELAGRLRRQEQDARMREDRTAALYALARELASTDQTSQIAVISARHASDSFAARAWLLTPGARGDLDIATSFPADGRIDSKDLGLAKWAFEHDDLAGLGTGTLPGSPVICAPLRVGHSRLGVLALLPTETAAFSADQRAFLDVFCRQVAVALERARLSKEARLAALRARTEELRSSLLSAVSHDLRTPLGSITGAATVLRDDPDLSSETRSELIESIVEEAERLEHLVSNLLDMTRLESRSVTLKRDWVPLDEILGSALTRLEGRLEDRRVSVQIDDDVPLLLVDPVLVEQIFVNLLENADKYTPPGTPIEIRAQCDEDYVAVDVIDHGPGIASGSEEKVFEKFFRGPHAGVAGAGLGLAICRAIAEAHGGTISAENLVVGGSAFRVRVPIGGTPPSLLLPSGVDA
jgi:two-component system sensor histidine kinase KdpD